MKKQYILSLLLIFLISSVYTESSPGVTNLGMKTVSSGATTVVGGSPIIGYPPRDWSEGDLCYFTKGCFIYDNDYHKSYCYPLGYRMNDTYCSEILKSESPGGYKKYEYQFLNQSEIFEICENHFECKSNFCFNNKCIGNIEDKINRLNEEIDNLKNLINKLEKNVELINESELINDSIEEKKEDTSEQKNYLELFRKFLNLK